MEIAERGHRVAEEHDAKAREHEVVGSSLERMRAGIAHHERGVVDSLGPRRLHQHFRNVGAQHMTLWPDRLRQCLGRDAGAAADVEHMLA